MCGRGRDGPEAGGRALRAGTAGNVFVSHANECSPKSTCCPGGPQPPRGPSDQSRGPQPVSAPSPSRSHTAGSRAGAVAAGTGAVHGLVHRSRSAGRHRPWPLLSAGVRQGPLAPRKSRRFVFSGRQRPLDVKLPFLAAARLPLWGKKNRSNLRAESHDINTLLNLNLCYFIAFISTYPSFRGKKKPRRAFNTPVPPSAHLSHMQLSACRTEREKLIRQNSARCVARRNPQVSFLRRGQVSKVSHIAF